MKSSSKSVDDKSSPEASKESVYVHRYSAYIADLKKSWAYAGQNKVPKVKYDSSGK